MAGKIALVDYSKCSPGDCKDGSCAAALVCSYKLLKQEKSYDVPMSATFICRGCGNCVRACPRRAIKIVNN